MQSLGEIALPFLDVEEPEFSSQPVLHMAEARRAHPWLARCRHGYIITEYAAMKDLLFMDPKMRTAGDGVIEIMGAQGTEWGRFQQEHILAISGDRHKRVRDVLAPMFTPKKVDRHRALMRQVIATLLDEWAPKERFDFEEFASYFPITVMCSLIGASPGVVPGLRSSLETLGLSFNLIPGHLPALNEATLHIQAFATDLVAARRAGDRRDAQPDLLDALIEANDAGQLSDVEVNDLLIFLFVAGYDTSKNVLTLIMKALLDRPDIYERCAEDRGYCTKVVEEGLRFTNTVTVPRLPREDIVYRDVLIPKDSMLFFPASVATRDPSAVPDAEEFLPEREQVNKHLAFGRGKHICLGQFIARAQIEEGLNLIAQRLRKPRQTAPNGWRSFLGVWGLKTLPLAFEDAGAHASDPASPLPVTA